MNIVKKYNMELLFQKRDKVGENILNFIKDNGYTKSGFAKITNISRPTLDKLINGEIDSITTFTTHIQKIIDSQNISEIDLLEDKPKSDNTPINAFSDNSPENHERKPEAKEMFMILDDIISLYEMYYNK
ncbi:helix-turn-helix domain-containing protein [Paramaledivibacter caminithermalis]|uniref:Cro/C1-type HTH DNA-binding domain-containing protein n=1 Tax=Paramaledivibacter caminithermalis (strain DSM 15212 / CIP 107654 / DViRD3) TaxID=1121301 RepID=A0A1M6M961_PARC5|nr:helix-turn-helix transcriptional regulator [Paramaledivibacter caminithermalis]SHJ79996.1 Cro/C1-type HTH DNA-binding domain-containing protein [Paramaledivibacter caminithermalis DSM 15212]